MDKNKKNAAKIGLAIGIAGTIAGIFLLFSEQWFVGVSGTVASAAIAIKGYMDLQANR